MPREGRHALRQATVAPHAWLADGRVADPAELLAPELLFADEGGSLETAAVVVKGSLAFDVPAHEELEALRLAVRHLAARHKPIRAALEATAEIPAQPLTPLRLLQAGIDEIVEALDRASVGGQATRATARQSLMRARRYSVLDVLGADHLVARWTPPGAGEPWAAYLPVEARSSLPLEPSFAMRAAVTVHPRQDPDEPGPRALRIHALARVIATEALGSPPALEASGKETSRRA